MEVIEQKYELKKYGRGWYRGIQFVIRNARTYHFVKGHSNYKRKYSYLKIQFPLY